MITEREIKFTDNATTPKTTTILDTTKETTTKYGFLDDMEIFFCDLSEGSKILKEILEEIVENTEVLKHNGTQRRWRRFRL